MDQVIDFLAQNPFGVTTQATNVRPDGLGTTYHESGIIANGDDPTQSVVNPDGQFHHLTNLYAERQRRLNEREELPVNQHEV